MAVYNLRQVKIEDASALAHLQVDSYRSAYAGLLPQHYLDHFTYEEQTHDWREWLSAPCQDIILVAEEATAGVVGYAADRAGKTPFEPYDSELLSLHVRKSFQGLGIGRRLFARVATNLEQRGRTSLMLWVLEANPARAWYERFGGVLIGKQLPNLGEEGQSVLASEVAYGWPEIPLLGKT